MSTTKKAAKKQSEWLAMILAGGKGARLGALTDYAAKPAIPFGGSNRIIDFTLNNCACSGMKTVGVLTQYRASELHNYIGNNSAWTWDSGGGLYMLPASDTGAPYTGTANAVYHNMEFIERYAPEHVLILSGDHIYEMDYRDMLRFHSEKNADATISVVSVPWEEAFRFGVMNTDAGGRITYFTEKPAEPKSNLASMGVYLFKWSRLKQYLADDQNNPRSGHDFGKNLIPAMLSAGEKLYAYQFDGYWRDVGTLLSLWESNMDLLRQPMPIDMDDERWRIYARNPGMPPHYVAPGARTANTLMTEGCEVYGEVRGSVLFAGVRVEAGAQVLDAVIMPHAVVARGARIMRAIVAEDAVIGAGCSIGEPAGGIAVIGPGAVLAPGTVVPAGKQVDADANNAKKGGSAR